MYRVLIVDDEPWALRGYENVVKWGELGFEICSMCISSHEALERIRQLKPDVVITDIRMPNMNGLQLIHTCKSEGISAEFLVVSGFDDFYYVQEAMNLGAFYYMLKPVSSEEMSTVISRLREQLDLKRNARNLKIRELLRQIYISENTTATYRDVFTVSKQEEQWNGTVVLQESELNQLSLRVFSREVHSISLRITTNLTAYFILTPVDLIQSLDRDVFASADEMGVRYYGTEVFPLDTPVNQAVRLVEKALSSGSALVMEEEKKETPPTIGEIRYQNKDIQKIVEYIHSHYTETLSLERISTEFHFSFSYICHMFKRETGVTFLEYLTEVRMKRACELLQTTELEVKKIAAMVGYADYYYFCRIFKKKFGYRPSHLRNAGEEV